MYLIFLIVIAYTSRGELLSSIRKDLYTHKEKYKRDGSYKHYSGSILMAAINPAFGLILSYRVYNYLYKSSNPVIRKLGILIYYIASRRYSCDIHPASTIGSPLKIGHASDIIVGPLVEVGQNCYIFNGVSIGNKYVGEKDAMPKVGDNAILGTGSKILGPCILGDSTTVGALTLVIQSVSAGHTVTGVPGTTHKK